MTHSHIHWLTQFPRGFIRKILIELFYNIRFPSQANQNFRHEVFVCTKNKDYLCIWLEQVILNNCRIFEEILAYGNWFVRFTDDVKLNINTSLLSICKRTIRNYIQLRSFFFVRCTFFLSKIIRKFSYSVKFEQFKAQYLKKKCK